MWKPNLGAMWRDLNDHAALPISIVAVAFTGLTYCSDQQQAAEDREINQSVVWRSEPLSDEEGVRLSQPNAAVAVQRVTLTFSHRVMDQPLEQPPSRLEIRNVWLTPGMSWELRDCAKRDYAVLIIGQMPVVVTTYYRVAGENRIANDVYTLSYIANVDQSGTAWMSVESLAIAGVEGKAEDLAPLIANWAPEGCKKANIGYDRPTSIRPTQ